MSITSSEIIINRPNGANTRRIREKHTDHLGKVYINTYDLHFNEGEDVASLVDTKLADNAVKRSDALKQTELDKYLEAVRSNINPFIEYSIEYNDRNTLLKHVLDSALSSSATDSIVFNGLPYLSLVEDAELMFLYSKDQAWVDSIRIQATNLLANKNSLEDYVPILEQS